VLNSYELKRLGDEPFGAQPRDLDRLLERAEARDHHRENVRIPAQGFVQHLAAVNAGQPQVGDQDVVRKCAQPLERFLAGAGLIHPEALVAQTFGNRVSKRGLVIHEEHAKRGVNH